MAKQDLIPNQNPDFVAWFDNFRTSLSVHGPTLGLTAAEVTAVGADFTLVDTKHTVLNTRKAEQQAAVADFNTVRADATSRIRAIARRLKSHPMYTVANGESMGIVGPEDTTDLNNSKPTLQLISAANGQVKIGFNKSISSGVKIFSKRGAETAFTMLAVDTVSPYDDTRPNLGPGPETRSYNAKYLLDDDEIGLISDTLNVTVPA